MMNDPAGHQPAKLLVHIKTLNPMLSVRKTYSIEFIQAYKLQDLKEQILADVKDVIGEDYTVSVLTIQGFRIQHADDFLTIPNADNQPNFDSATSVFLSCSGIGCTFDTPDTPSSLRLHLATSDPTSSLSDDACLPAVAAAQLSQSLTISPFTPLVCVLSLKTVANASVRIQLADVGVHSSKAVAITGATENTSIRELQQLILQQCGPHYRKGLLYEGREMIPDSTLADYGIRGVAPGAGAGDGDGDDADTAAAAAGNTSTVSREPFTVQRGSGGRLHTLRRELKLEVRMMRPANGRSGFNPILQGLASVVASAVPSGCSGELSAVPCGCSGALLDGTQQDHTVQLALPSGRFMPFKLQTRGGLSRMLYGQQGPLQWQEEIRAVVKAETESAVQVGHGAFSISRAALYFGWS